MRPFFENNVLQQQLFKPMIIVVDTTKAGSASNTFVLPIIKATTETVKIYWGDGTSSMGVNGDNTHVYAASGVYTVKIESKIFGGLYFNNTGDKAKITKVIAFGDAINRSVANAFYGCTSLNACSADTKSIATSSANMFRSNTALTTVPLINISTFTNTDTMFSFCTFATVPLFNMSNVTSSGSMFSYCAALTTVPLFNLSSVTNAYAMFYQCTALTTVPLFNLSSVTSTQSMFAYCAALTTVPLFNLSSVTSTQAMFYQCTALTTVPLLNLSSVTNAYTMFLGCTALTTVPLFDLSKVTNASYMFHQCSKLTTVPLLDLSSVTDATNMFRNCAALTTVPLLNLSSVTNAGNMFSGVTLTTQSYSDFLINLATLPLQSGVSFHGGNSKYNPTAAIARAYLISNFGWTITDGGAA